MSCILYSWKQFAQKELKLMTWPPSVRFSWDYCMRYLRCHISLPMSKTKKTKKIWQLTSGWKYPICPILCLCSISPTPAVVLGPSRNHILSALQDCLSLILFHSSPVHLNPSIWPRDVHNDLCQLRERAPSISTTCNVLVCVQKWCATVQSHHISKTFKSSYYTLLLICKEY